MSCLLHSSLGGIPLRARGKVRDIYEVGGDLLIVATDRISAFDYILPTGIPRKGEVLTQMSLFWLDLLGDIAPNHLITADVSSYPAELAPFTDQIRGRSMLVRKAEMVDVECVARGYISGSGWKDYKASQMICGIPMPAGLRESERLAEPLFTPASKAATGHDENISFEDVCASTGPEIAARLRDLTLAIYKRAADYTADRGILLADSKFEFGFVNGVLTLADEVLTPDSSRFWPRESYRPGGPQPSFDKQYVRDYLESIHWNKKPPAPELPAGVVSQTSAKYLEAFRLITGRSL